MDIIFIRNSLNKLWNKPARQLILRDVELEITI